MDRKIRCGDGDGEGERERIARSSYTRAQDGFAEYNTLFCLEYIYSDAGGGVAAISHNNGRDWNGDGDGGHAASFSSV